MRMAPRQANKAPHLMTVDNLARFGCCCSTPHRHGSSRPHLSLMRLGTSVFRLLPRYR